MEVIRVLELHLYPSGFTDTFILEKVPVFPVHTER